MTSLIARSIVADQLELDEALCNDDSTFIEKQKLTRDALELVIAHAEMLLSRQRSRAARRGL